MEFKIANSHEDIETCLCIRRIVFTQEQNVPESREIDDKEDDSMHFLVKKCSKHIAVGRLHKEDNTAVIGRIAVLKKYRGTGAGLFIMENIVNFAKEDGFKRAFLGAQEQAIGFYEKLGFKVCSDVYMDAGIPHYKMEKILT